MNPMIETETLHAFVDGELDPLASRALEARIEADDALRARVVGLRQWRRAIGESADYHAAPDALRARIAALGGGDAAPASTPSPGMSLPVRVGWRALGAALALALVATVGLDSWREHAGADDRLSQEVVASHVRATLGERLVDVASSDHHTVRPWLSSKLDFSPPVPDQPLPGTPFVGGRVDYLDGHPVAALVFRHGSHVVDSFVWPSDAPDHAVVVRDDRGFRIAHWTRARMTHWTISDVNAAEFDAIVKKLAASD